MNTFWNTKAQLEAALPHFIPGKGTPGYLNVKKLVERSSFENSGQDMVLVYLYMNSYTCVLLAPDPESVKRFEEFSQNPPRNVTKIATLYVPKTSLKDMRDNMFNF
jgi:hypothetical protein